jgi:hypothetical protein
VPRALRTTHASSRVQRTPRTEVSGDRSHDPRARQSRRTPRTDHRVPPPLSDGDAPFTTDARRR